MESNNKLVKFDIVIVGGGIIGITLAIHIAKNDKNTSILVIEKEKGPGLHASGRNSGVIHAGFYYGPNTLKAKFCKEGNQRLHEKCAELSVPVTRTGKVVVTQNSKETPELEKLFHRAIENGVEVQILEDKFLSNFEPLAKSSGGFIWSPTTSVSDPKLLISKLAQQAKDLGVQFAFGSKPEFRNGRLIIDEAIIGYRHLVNSAGTQAIEIAQLFGAGKNYSMMPFLGTYAYLDAKTLPLRTLVYPLPHSVNPFLGVHFTITSDGFTKIGPSAIPIIGGEQYDFSIIPRTKEIRQTIKSFLAMGMRHPNSTLGLIRREVPKISLNNIVKEANKLVPSASKSGVWKRKPGGIRSQLVDLRSGRLEQDFIVESTNRETHILNAVSPGWTSSIPFVEWIYDQYILPKITNHDWSV